MVWMLLLRRILLLRMIRRVLLLLLVRMLLVRVRRVLLLCAIPREPLLCIAPHEPENKGRTHAFDPAKKNSHVQSAAEHTNNWHRHTIQFQGINAHASE
jgi:hypothetical protein